MTTTLAACQVEHHPYRCHLPAPRAAGKTARSLGVDTAAYASLTPIYLWKGGPLVPVLADIACQREHYRPPGLRLHGELRPTTASLSLL